MKRDATIHMKISPELKRRLTEIATASNRSLSNLIETMLAELANKSVVGGNHD